MASNKRLITKEQWLAAIEKSGGVTEEIARILKIHRQTVWRRSKEEPWIAEAIADQNRVCIDLALVGIRSHIEKKNAKVCMWYLDRKAKDLGFGKSLDLNANVNMQAKIVVYMPDDGREAKQQEVISDASTESIASG